MAVQATDQRYQQIFSTYFDAVRGYCLRRLPHDEAADAVSEIFLIAWRRIDEVPTGDEARLWLFGVARNVVRNTSRSSRRRHRVITRLSGAAALSPADPETQVVAADEHREVLIAFHNLDPRDQEVLRLRLWEELSVAETARVLQINEKAASKRYQRALTRLAAAQESVQKTRPHSQSRGGEQ